MKEIIVDIGDGTTRYFLNDQLHREDGPALIRPDGTLYWYKNGQLHREDGPAVIYSDGGKEWRVNGELHRLDGPAVTRTGGKDEWRVLGKKLPENKFNNLYKKLGFGTHEQFVIWCKTTPHIYVRSFVEAIMNS